jgi:hypothetical protein
LALTKAELNWQCTRPESPSYLAAVITAQTAERLNLRQRCQRTTNFADKASRRSEELRMDRNTKMAGTALVFLLLATLQGCHCWGWYHYHNCYVYLGTPPGAKTYGHPWFAPGWYSGWPYGYTSPAFGYPVGVSYSPIYAEAETAGQPSVTEIAPMPRAYPEGSQPDLLLPPPRPTTPPAEKPVSPEPSRAAPGSGLQLRFTGPQQTTLSENITCTLTLHNAGDSALDDLELVLHLPKVIQLVSSSPATQVRGNEAVWKFARLVPGQTETVTLTLRPVHTANQAICHASVLARDGTGAATVHAIRILPSDR